MKIFDVANRGNKEFTLDSHLHEIMSGGPHGDLVGIGFRVRFSAADKDIIIAPPLYGKAYQRSAQEEDLNQRNAQKLLEDAREGGYIPIYYRIGRTIDNPGEAVERLKSVLRLGVKVAELAVVPFSPRSAKETNIYLSPPMERTYDRVDAFFADRLGTRSSMNEISLFQPSDQDPDAHIENAS